MDDHLRPRPAHGLRDLIGIKRVRDHRHSAQLARASPALTRCASCREPHDPAATRRGTSCFPIAPVAPATNTLIISSLIEDYPHPQDKTAAPAVTPPKPAGTESERAAFRDASLSPALCSDGRKGAVICRGADSNGAFVRNSDMLGHLWVVTGRPAVLGGLGELWAHSSSWSRITRPLTASLLGDLMLPIGLKVIPSCLWSTSALASISSSPSTCLSTASTPRGTLCQLCAADH